MLYSNLYAILEVNLLTIQTFLKTGEKFWPSSTYQRVMLCVLGLFGSLIMLTSFSCIKFMPVADAITLMFTTPLFTIVLAAVFLKDKITTIKTISGK